jgi:predicted metal-binding membrane protein
LPTRSTESASVGLRRTVFLTAVVGLVVLALFTFCMWGILPHGFGDPTSAPGHEAWRAHAAFLAGWTLMIVVMMVPTTSTLVYAFASVVRHRPGRRRLQACLIAGYVGVWLGVACVFRIADMVLRVLLTGSDWLTEHPWVIGAAALGLAGMYQFTPVLRRCLTACRSPRGFIYRYWHGRHAYRDGLRIGQTYGLSCVGCCWALMLVMFTAGVASLLWMVGLAVVMAVEKNTRWGHALRVPVGIALIGIALLVIAVAPSDGHQHS